MKMKSLKTVFFALFFSLLFLFSSGNAYAMIEVPGCRDAWKSIGAEKQLSNLEILVKNDCAVLHRQGFRLPEDGGNYDPKVCAPAWNSLIKADKSEDVEFMITHNCPVFYRKGWETCS